MDCNNLAGQRYAARWNPVVGMVLIVLGAFLSGWCACNGRWWPTVGYVVVCVLGIGLGEWLERRFPSRGSPGQSGSHGQSGRRP